MPCFFSWYKGASAPNLSDENDHHEVVLRMDPEGFDFESKPKLTEASLVWQFKSVLKKVATNEYSLQLSPWHNGLLY